jgi:L-alanine-DL-glutamate epimerase-like enolase superfamily enzyme
MAPLSRRSFLRASAAALAPFSILAAKKPTDIKIDEVSSSYEDYLYRVPIKFGGTPVDRVTLLNVNCVVSNRTGKSVKGFGSMPLGNIWAWPSQKYGYEQTLAVMKAMAERMEKVTAGYKEYGHPIDINHNLDADYTKATDAVRQQRGITEPIPQLATLVVASPFDAAIHDAFGKLYGVSSYKTYGPEHMSYDLGHYIGPEFKGEHLSKYVLEKPKRRMPLYHLVGALDPLVESDIQKRVNDGMPETLPEWINHNGLTNIKIKLNGSDLKWDVDRVLGVDRVSAETQKKRGVSKWVYSLDFNEKCPNVEYLLTFLRQIKERAPAGFTRIQYIEQPTSRDLKSHRENVMHEAAKLMPIVVDEAFDSEESFQLAREMGYTGAALKACKTQSHALLMGAVVQKAKMFLCVQDLTCPGASLIHSAGLSAHVPGVAAIEANSRQYVPAANKGWEKKHPGLFIVKDGMMDTSTLDRPGLSAV